MSTHTTERKPRASNHPNARRVGPHLVVVETARVPGVHPESHLRERGQRAHAERYCRCLYCGAERLRAEDLPVDCCGAGDAGAEGGAD